MSSLKANLKPIEMTNRVSLEILKHIVNGSFSWSTYFLQLLMRAECAFKMPPNSTYVKAKAAHFNVSSSYTLFGQPLRCILCKMTIVYLISACSAIRYEQV